MTAAAAAHGARGRGYGNELMQPLREGLDLLKDVTLFAGINGVADVLSAAARLVTGVIQSDAMERGDLKMQARRQAKP